MTINQEQLANSRKNPQFFLLEYLGNKQKCREIERTKNRKKC